MTSWFTKTAIAGYLMALSFALLGDGREFEKINTAEQKNCMLSKKTVTEKFAKNSTMATDPGCGDAFFDPGGPDGNYTDNVVIVTTICPDQPGQFVEVSFNSFQTVPGEDYLNVYNGPGTSNPINIYSGDYIPPVISSSDGSGCLTFQFAPQGTETASGWEATIACVDCPRPNEFRVYETAPSSARLNWWHNPGGVSWYVEVGPPGFQPGTGAALSTQNVNFPEVFLSGLEGNTSYDAYVRNNCANGQSAFAGPLSFRTAPSCGDSFTDPGGPNGSFHPVQAHPVLICPDVPGTFVSVDFQQLDMPDSYGPLYIYDGLNGAFLGAYTTSNQPPSPINATNNSGCLLFNPTVNFLAGPAEGWEATVTCLDCPSLNNLTANNLASNSVTLNWPLVNLAIDHYEWEVGLPGFEPGTGAAVKTGTVESFFQNTNITGLESATEYDACMRIICQGNLPGGWRRVTLTTAPSCGENFYDPGGPDGVFPLDQITTTIICPDQPGLFTSVTFNELDLLPECCNFIEVSSGDGSSSTYLGKITGTNSPLTVNSYHPSGCLTFAFFATGDTATTGWEATVACVTCPAPFGLAAAYPGTSTVQISWGQLNAATFYEWEVGLVGFTPGSGTSVATGTTVSTLVEVTGLESGTQYEVYVRSRCGANDASAFTGPVKFITTPGCGDSYYDSGGPDGQYKPYEDTYATICPDAPGQFVQADFTEFDVSSCCALLEIKDGPNWYDPFIGSYNGTNKPGRVSAINPTGCLHFRFYSSSAPVGDGWKADISCVTCPLPNGFYISQLGGETVELGWTTNSKFSAYYWEVGPPGFLPGTGNAVAFGTVSSNLILVTGLESGTTYHAYLRGICGSNDASSFTSPLVFTTNPSCGDYFYDLGGPNEDFPIWGFSTTICPDVPGTYVQANFEAFDLGTCCSGLTAIDANTYWGPTINTWSGTNSPDFVTASNSSGCLTFTFSPGGEPAPGWEAAITCVDCPNPYGLIANTAQVSNVQLAWTMQIPVLSYYYEVGLQGFTPGNGEAILSGTVNNSWVNLSTLEGSTTYDYYVKTICLNNAGESIFSGPHSFTTPPTCGDLFTDTGGTDGDYGFADYYNLYICPDQPGQYVQVNFSEFNIPPCCGTLAFYDSQWLGTFNGDQLPPVITSNGGDGCLNVQFAAGGQPGPGWVAEVTCIACPYPNRVTSNRSTSSSIRLNWSQVPSAVSYEWEAGLPGFTPGTGQSVASGTTAELTASAEDLESGTTYEFYVRTNCSGGNVSAFTGPLLLHTAPGCDEVFYDPAGPDSSYTSGNLHATTVICPDEPGQAVQVTFNSFVIHPWEDYLYVYNGDSENAPSLGVFNGMSPLPGPFEASNPSGCLTFFFNAAANGTWEGWEASVECVACPVVSGLSVSGVASDGAEFTWTTLPSATGYEWEVGQQGFLPGTGNAIASGSTTATSATVNGLDSGLDYQVAIRALCGPGENGAWSSAVSFRTALTCGGAFYDSGGPNGYYGSYENIQTTICPEFTGQKATVNFTSFSTEGCCDYLQIFDGPSVAFPQLAVLSGQPSMPQTYTSTHPGGCLTFAFYSDGSVSGDGWVATVECEGCIAPLNFSVSDPVFNGAKLSWESLPFANSYNWEVGPAGFTPGIGMATLAGNTAADSVNLSGLLPDTDYQAYVRSICAGNQPGPFAGPLSFSTLLACGSKSYDTGGPSGDYGPNEDYFTLICPEIPGNYISLDFTFFETQACCDFLEILNGKTENAPSLGSFSGTTIPGNFTSTDDSGCLLLHFTSDGSIHRGGWEAAVQCSPTGVHFAGDFKGNFEAYPNPVDGQLQVRFNFPAREMASVTLSDVTGRKVADRKSEAVSGENTWQFDCSELPSGAYFVSLKSVFGNATLRVVKQ